MIDTYILKEILQKYKQDFNEFQWNDEKYKWEAVKYFQDNWDIEARDFQKMLEQSLAKTHNLLESANNYSKAMIIEFAKKDPQYVQNMYRDLFDENKDLVKRILDFRTAADRFLELYPAIKVKKVQHYQTENAISTYLWLRYPDKYYIYKYSEVKNIIDLLKTNYTIKRGDYLNNLINFYKLYDEVCEQIKQDKELIALLKANITAECYKDDECKTLTIDVGFYISRIYIKYIESNRAHNAWFPEDYSPNFTVEDWVGLIKDNTLFTDSSLTIVKCLKDYGGAATCKQLSKRYGRTPQFYNAGSSALAKRIADKTKCPVLEKNTDNSKWWPIIYLGKYSDNKEDGVYIWKLREELSRALDRVDLTDIKLYEKESNQPRAYFWLTANPKIWSFSDIKIGEQQAYTLYNHNGNKRRVFQRFLDAKVDDIIIGYAASPIKQIVAICRVCKANDGKNLYIEKIQDIDNPIDYKDLKECEELSQMEYFQNPQGSLFKLTEEEYNFIQDLISAEVPIQSEEKSIKYNKVDFLKEVFISESLLERLSRILLRKKNIILQGAPGVGKTFLAKRLAYVLLGEKADKQIEFVQFHQNYTYEDFVMGYKPNDEGFSLKYGIFYKFCQKAKNNPEKKFFFIIDEINRGNLSKIFGELLMLIEENYRGVKSTLAYDGCSFYVPENVYIIGMMNTSDRSLALIDYALRRRFSFFEIKPAFESKQFIDYQKALNNSYLDSLIKAIQQLNNEINEDDSLGKGFCIGHSYFCGLDNYAKEDLLDIVDFEILPMIREYWFDDEDKIEYWENVLHGVFR